jgi:PAS domain S-box-containing protein
MEERRTVDVPVDVERRKSSIEEALEYISGIMDIIAIISKDDKIYYANNSFLNIFGYTKEELSDLHVSDIFVEENKEILTERLKRRLEEQVESLPDKYIDIEFKKKDGTRITCNIYPDTLMYKGQKCVMYIGNETTQQLKLRKALNGFFEYCPVPAFIKDKNKRMIKATKYYEQNLHLTELEVIGKTSAEIFPTAFAQKIDVEDDFIFKYKRPLTVDETLDGRFYVKTKFPINGDLIGGFSIDVTDRIRARELLEESNKKYEVLYNLLVSFLDTIPEMIWVHDKNRNVVFSNKALKDSLMDIDMFEISEYSTIPTEKQTFVKKIMMKDVEMYLEITLTPLFDGDEEVVGCSGVVKDVTEDIIRQTKIIEKLETLENTTKKNTKEVMMSISSTMSKFSRGWVNDR